MKISIPSKINTKFIYDNTRYYTTLNGEHFDIPTVTLTGDFVISVDFSTTDTVSAYQMFTGTVGSNYTGIKANGDIVFAEGGTEIAATGTNANDGKLHTATFTRVGTTVTIGLDGSDVGSGTEVSNIVTTLIGAYDTASTYDFNGVLANVKITDQGTLTHYYKIDEDWSDPNNMVLRNYATTLGANVISNGSFDSDLSGWTIINEDGTHTVTWEADGARYESDTTSPILGFKQTSILTIGVTYLMGIKNTITSGLIKNTSEGNTPIPDGENQIPFTALSTQVEFLRGGTNVNTLIDNVIVRQADGYGTFNGSSANAELFTSVADGWVGAELVTNGNFVTDTDWLKGVGYTISSNAMHINANNTFSYQSLGLFITGRTYLIEGTISNYVSGIIKFAPHSTTTGTQRSANGTYTEILFSPSGGSEFFVDCDGVTVADVESVSGKRILEKP